MNILSKYQLEAGNNVIAAFENSNPWHLLFAQPQSGKTDTFYFIGAEMLRKDKINQIVVLCGTGDKQLKKQSLDSFCNVFGSISFCDKYDAYLETTIGLDREKRFELMRKLKSNVHHIWGHDLTKPILFKKDTLFIWEESHYAQNIGMRPFQFFKNHDITCDGNPGKLSSNNNYVLSVSATPFSELSHITQNEENQYKGKTFLKTDENYHGIESILKQNLLIGFESKHVETELKSILSSSRPQSYGIIRVFDEELEKIVTSTAKKCNWNTLSCNSNSKSRDIPDFKILNFKPSQNTLIIIKGMCRMGQVINKEFLSFVIETSIDTNAEALIQGLLGRTLGWHKYPIKVYVNNLIVGRNDPESYIKLIKGENILPKKTRNLDTKGKSLKRDAFTGNNHLPIVTNSEKVLKQWLKEFINL